MTTPTSVLFTPISRAPSEILSGFEGVLRDCGAFVQQAGRIGPDPDTGETSFLGDTVECSSATEAGTLAIEWGDIAVRVLADEPRAYVYLYGWWENPSWHYAMELESPVVYASRGRWLRKFMISVMSVIRADACAYGPAYEPGLFHSCDPLILVDDIRHGRLFNVGFPSFHMLSSRFISTNEARRLVERAALVNPRLTYEYTITDYHVIYEL
jgi:hypothetical protein